MQQTPVHEHHNPDLLKLIPPQSQKIIEIGCSSGALAREFKKINPGCHYVGVEIDARYAELAKRHCDETAVVNLNTADTSFYERHADKDCWIFGDVLEHLENPWNVLAQIRSNIPNNGSIVACIPNAQHWSLIARLSIGDFRYEDSGLLDRTHLRFFTRQTIIDLFSGARFHIVDGCRRIFDEPNREKFLPIIGDLAKACGVDPNVAIDDALPLQFVVRAEPA
jgi:2-polyprenyl-3-methyl-5-hydroxy-6-metoxy-1,4-benzoquinol methylase